MERLWNKLLTYDLHVLRHSGLSDCSCKMSDVALEKPEAYCIVLIDCGCPTKSNLPPKWDLYWSSFDPLPLMVANAKLVKKLQQNIESFEMMAYWKILRMAYAPFFACSVCILRLSSVVLTLTAATVYSVSLPAVWVVCSENIRLWRVIISGRRTELGQWEMLPCMPSATYAGFLSCILRVTGWLVVTEFCYLNGLLYWSTAVGLRLT